MIPTERVIEQLRSQLPDKTLDEILYEHFEPLAREILEGVQIHPFLPNMMGADPDCEWEWVDWGDELKRVTDMLVKQYRDDIQDLLKALG